MKLVVANLKMNLTFHEILEYSKEINNMKYNNIELIVCPAYPYISLLSLSLNEKNHLGSQDVSAYASGPYTGEVSSHQLADLRVSYCIVGHSERKKVYDESTLHIISKINNLQEFNITPILCIENNTKESIKKYLDSIIPKIKDTNNIVIAYEPIEAVGTGVMPNIDEICKVIYTIKEILKKEYKITCKVIYGGSVDEKNCKRILNNDIIDGVIIGKSCINIKNFKRILDKIEVIK